MDMIKLETSTICDHMFLSRVHILNCKTRKQTLNVKKKKSIVKLDV